MLTKFLLFYILYRVIGNPIAALVVIAVVYLAIDRTFFGFVPDPFRAFRISGRIRDLRRLIALNPHDARALKELGILMADRGDSKSAQGYFERAAPRMSDDPEFQYYHGITAARNGDIRKGRALIESALQVSPRLKYGEPYLMLAEVYIDRGDFKEALPLLGNFERIYHASPRGLYQMGLVKLKLGMEKEGTDMLKEAIRTFKTSPRYKRKTERKWVWKARLLLRKGA